MEHEIGRTEWELRFELLLQLLKLYELAIEQEKLDLADEVRSYAEGVLEHLQVLDADRRWAFEEVREVLAERPAVQVSQIVVEVGVVRQAQILTPQPVADRQKV